MGRAVGKAPLPENAVTNVIPTEIAERAPVFVDPSGRRRRRVRRVAYAIALVVLVILAAVWVSQLGGSVRPPAPPTSSVGR